MFVYCQVHARVGGSEKTLFPMTIAYSFIHSSTHSLTHPLTHSRLFTKDEEPQDSEEWTDWRTADQSDGEHSATTHPQGHGRRRQPAADDEEGAVARASVRGFV